MQSNLRGPIVLIGMMGAGKTTVGALLATQLGWPFVDNDHVIEAHTGQHPAELLRADAAEFRALESKLVIDELSSGRDMVFSVGGGAVLNSDTQAAMRKDATVVWLRASVETLLARVRLEVDTRPMLDGDPEERMRTLLGERTSIYESLADATIDVDTYTPEETVDAVIEAVS